jgi:queuosine precursor transporter
LTHIIPTPTRSIALPAPVDIAFAQKASSTARMTAPTPGFPRSLFFISVLYGGMVCLAGVLGNKQVSIGPLAVEAGIFAFLLLVVMSSAVAELHGEKTAQTLVRFGFVPMIVAIILSLAVLALPASSKMEPARVEAFSMMMGATPRIWIAGIIAYGVSQTLNVTIFSRLKAAGGRFVWLRGAVAGVASQTIDTLLFVTIAFLGVFPIMDLLMGQMAAKILLSALLVPFLIQGFVALGRRLDGQITS